MKRAVSISIGSSKRNKAVEATLLGQNVSIERIGTDGDMEAAAMKYKELDGTVDAFGVGGADLGALVDRVSPVRVRQPPQAPDVFRVRGSRGGCLRQSPSCPDRL